MRKFEFTTFNSNSSYRLAEINEICTDDKNINYLPFLLFTAI